MKTTDNPRAHGRTPRVLVPVTTLDFAARAFTTAVRKLDGPHADTELIRELLMIRERLSLLAAQKPARPRAPKGHAIVPKALLHEAIGDILDGANEFEDAAGYCNDTDAESCESHGDGMRQTASKLRRYAR
jgi:hypothetical protein